MGLFLFVSALCLVTINISLSSAKTFNCAGWQTCYGETLNCIAGESCIIGCGGQSSGDSCRGAIVNSNGASSIDMSCDDNQDCLRATINCGDSSICSVNCHSSNDGGASSTCQGVKLNCGTSDCSITCDKTWANCLNIEVDTTDAFAFRCYQVNFPSGATTNPCADAPARKFPQTKGPTSYPTPEPTIQDVSLPPTSAPWVVVSNITLQIIVKDSSNITTEDVTNLIRNTTNTFLRNTLSVEDDYELQVDVVRDEGDGNLLIVTIIVTANGDDIYIDEGALTARNEEEIHEQYGDKASVKNNTTQDTDNKNNDEIEWYIIVIIVLVIIVIGIALWFYIRKRKRTAMEDRLGLNSSDPDNVTNGSFTTPITDNVGEDDNVTERMVDEDDGMYDKPDDDMMVTPGSRSTTTTGRDVEDIEL